MDDGWVVKGAVALLARDLSVQARGIHGEPTRRGRIVEILGEPGHEHYKVHWDERHDSIVYPADGVLIVHKKAPPITRWRAPRRSPRGRPSPNIHELARKDHLALLGA